MGRGLTKVHTWATVRVHIPTQMFFPLNYDDNPASQENVFMIQSMSCSGGLATGFRTRDVNPKRPPGSEGPTLHRLSQTKTQGVGDRL